MSQLARPWRVRAPARADSLKHGNHCPSHLSGYDTGMRALFLDHDGVALRPDHPEPIPSPGEVSVRVLRAGICETDLQLIRGYKGFRGVLGHEFVGVALDGVHAGRRVVAEINCSCWQCATCLAGRPGHCPTRTVLGIVGHDGAFADLIAVPERNLHVVPDGVETDDAVFTEPLAAAFQIPAQVAIKPNDRIVVLGDGRLGNLCAQVLAQLSDRVMVVGKHEAKLALLSSMGSRHGGWARHRPRAIGRLTSWWTAPARRRG